MHLKQIFKNITLLLRVRVNWKELSNEFSLLFALLALGTQVSVAL